MTSKQFHFGQPARRAFSRGIDTLADAVRVTLGPRGRNVVIDRPPGAPITTKDGVTVAREIELVDPFENMGAQLVKEVASKTSEQAGDGTTTATVLAQAIFREGVKMVSGGYDPMELRRGIDAAVGVVVKSLQTQSRRVRSDDDIAQIGTISANGDEEIGSLLSEAMARVGRDGVITIEEGHSNATALEVVEGMQFDRGYISPYFVTDPATMEVVLENCSILCHEKKVASMDELLPILEKVAKDGTPLLIVAEDVTGDALAMLVVNRLRGSLLVAAVKTPGFGEQGKDTLEDIAVLTGGRAVTAELGENLSSLQLADLGSAARVVIGKDSTTIIDGAGKPSAIAARVKQLRHRIEATTSEYDREKLEARVAKLAAGVAVLKIGAPSEMAVKEKQARVTDALHATRAAVEEGIVPGGGVALLRATVALKKLVLDSPQQQVGVSIMVRAIQEPLRQIVENAGGEPSVVVARVLAGKRAFGFNARTGEFGDLVDEGVIDPTKVVRCAIENAASVAGMMLATEAMVATYG